MKTQEWIVDSVLSISVIQPTFGRIFNSGIIHITIATFVNADAETTTLTFAGIRNPHGYKHELMRAIPSIHEGVLVKIPPQSS